MTAEITKDQFKKLYSSIDITDINLQNKINNIYLYSQRKSKDKRNILDKI